jgi:hypothetical protein
MMRDLHDWLREGEIVTDNETNSPELSPPWQADTVRIGLYPEKDESNSQPHTLFM